MRLRASSACERAAHEGDGGGQVAGDERRGDAEDAVAGALQDGIPVRVEVLTPRVDFAVDLDDEASLAAGEVGDVAGDDHLAAEGEAEATAAKCCNRFTDPM